MAHNLPTLLQPSTPSPCTHETTFFASCTHAFKLIIHHDSCNPTAAAQVTHHKAEADRKTDAQAQAAPMLAADQVTEVGGSRITCPRCGTNHVRQKCVNVVLELVYVDDACEIYRLMPCADPVLQDGYGVRVYCGAEKMERRKAWREMIKEKEKEVA